MISVRSSSFFLYKRGKLNFYCFKSIGYNFIPMSIIFFLISSLFYNMVVLRKSFLVERGITHHEIEAYILDC